jgi:hypothetical protein
LSELATLAMRRLDVLEYPIVLEKHDRRENYMKNVLELLT